MNIMFGYKTVVKGGAETLILRLSRHINNDGHNVYLICSYIDAAMKKEFDSSNIAILDFNNPNNEILSKLDLVVCNSIYEYLYFLLYSRKNNFKYTCIMYVVHPNAITHAVFNRFKFINYFISRLYRSITREMINNDCLVFMDEMCFRDSNKVLCLNDQFEFNCIPIPFRFCDYDYNLLKQKIIERTKEFRILSVARADFPFKGYLKGLINIFHELNNEFSNIRLEIVTSYSDSKSEKNYVELKSLISRLKNRNIHIIDGLEYKYLLDKYKTSHLYIGMGTTLLEAACNLNVVIPVEPYTYECKCESLFNNRIGWVCADWGKGKDATSTIRDVVKMGDKLYEKIVRETYNECKKTYDINRVSEKIYMLSNSKKLSRKYILIARVLYMEYTIFRTIKKMVNFFLNHKKTIS